MRLFAIYLTVSLFCLPGVAQAQTLTDVKAGDPVRITAVGTRAREAVFERLSGDTIVLRSANAADERWTVQYWQVQRFEVRSAAGGSKGAKGALIGAVGGFAVAFVVLLASQQCSYECGETTLFATLLSVPSAIVGGIVGWFVGHARKTEGWQELSLPLRVTG